MLLLHITLECLTLAYLCQVYKMMALKLWWVFSFNFINLIKKHVVFQVELLKTSDIKPNLERVRDSGAKIVIVDFAPDLIKQFFIEVRIITLLLKVENN